MIAPAPDAGKKRLPLIPMVALLATIVAGLVGCRNQQPPAPALPETPALVLHPVQPLIPGQILAFSPDSAAILTHTKGGLRFWSVAAGQFTGPTMQASGGAILSPDGKWVVTVEGDGGARLWAVGEDPPKPRVLPQQHQHAIKAAFAPDSKRVAVAGFEAPNIRESHTIEVFTLPDGQPVGKPINRDHGLRLKLGVAERGQLEFSPDGKYLTTILPYGVKRWDVKTGEGENEDLFGSDHELEAYLQSPGRAYQVRFTGKAADASVFARWDGRFTVLGLGKTVERFYQGRVTVALSPDGKRMATCHQGGTVTLWKMPDADKIDQPCKLVYPECTLAFNPGNTWLATLSHMSIHDINRGKSSLRLWSPSTGEPLSDSVEIPDCQGYSMMVSPDGNFILTVLATPEPSARLWRVK